MNKISIIIPTYKRYRYIYNAVSNVLKQDYPDYEIIIIDDNGIGTIEQKKTFLSISPLLEKYNNIRYIPNLKNSGACKARNEGIRNAQGDYIAFLDDDDIWHPSFLTNMIRTSQNKETGIVYSNFYRLNESGFFYNINEKFYSGYIQDELLSGWCPATTSLFFINKKLLIEYGGFDEKLKNLEEYDLWLRLSRENRFEFCNKRLVIKSESEHDQLTNNYNSRIEAWKELKKIWEQRIISKKIKDNFFKMIDENIKNESYHKDLQMISKIALPPKSQYGIKRTCILLIAKYFGTKSIINIKQLFSTLFGQIRYLSKEYEKSIKKEYNII